MWFVLRHSCSIGPAVDLGFFKFKFNPRPGAILSTECGHSTSANLFWAIQSIIDTNQSASAAAAAVSAIIAAGLSRRRQLVLALELATQYFMRSSRIIATTVGRATYGDQFVARQSTGASTVAYAFRCRNREAQPHFSCRGPSLSDAYCFLHLPCRPTPISLQC